MGLKNYCFKSVFSKKLGKQSFKSTESVFLIGFFLMPAGSIAAMRVMSSRERAEIEERKIAARERAIREKVESIESEIEELFEKNSPEIARQKALQLIKENQPRLNLQAMLELNGFLKQRFGREIHG